MPLKKKNSRAYTCHTALNLLIFIKIVDNKYLYFKSKATLSLKILLSHSYHLLLSCLSRLDNINFACSSPKFARALTAKFDCGDTEFRQRWFIFTNDIRTVIYE